MKRLLPFLAFFFLSAISNAQNSYPGAENSHPTGAGEPPNDPPNVNSTPAPTCVEGFAQSLSLVPEVFSDPESDTLDINIKAASCTLPTGVTIDDANDEIDCATNTVAGTTPSCILEATDTAGSNTTVETAAFSVVVSAIPAAGTIYERDMFGVPRTGTSGANESGGARTAMPIAELNDIIPIEISDYTCDATVTTGDGDWTTKVNNASNVVVCIAAGDHSSKDTMVITDGGSAGTSRTISAITLNNPVRVDFTAAHGWTTNDIIHCDNGSGGTWQLRWRYFRVTVIDTDTVDLQNQDGSGAGTRPAWATYTSGGTCQRPNFKIIRHAVDISVHPALLASGNRAKVMRFSCGTSSASIDYLMIIGLSFDHKGLDSSIGTTSNWIYACDYFIFDQNHDYNVEALTDITADFKRNGLGTNDGGADAVSQFVQIQRNFFDERGTDTLGTDSHWLTMSGIGTHRAFHLIKNESSSAMSAWQLQGSNTIAQEGFLFAENSDYLTTRHLTDCSGNIVGGDTLDPDDASPCAVAESAGAFKNSFGTEGRLNVTNANRHRLIVVDANVQCCRRDEDSVLSDGGSGGQSYGISTAGTSAPDIRNILWRNNVVFAEEKGIFVLKSTSGSVQNYMTVVGNIYRDFTQDSGTAMPWFTHPGNTTEKLESMFNTVVASDNWANVRRLTNTVMECNLFVDAGARQSAVEGSYTQKNNYGYGNTTQMDGTGDNDGGAASNANMADLTINPKLYSDAAFSYTLTGVLSTSSSPHLGDCPSIGASDQGVTDDTVTF